MHFLPPNQQRQSTEGNCSKMRVKQKIVYAYIYVQLRVKTVQGV